MGSLLDLLLGTGEFERDDAPEPSLLPHLARMAHAFDVERVVVAADRIARRGALAPPWYPLWEAVLGAIVANPDARPALLNHAGLGEQELGVRAAMADDPWAGADDRAADLLASGEPGLAALTAPHVTMPMLDTIVAELDPTELPAEWARRLLVGRASVGATLDAGWLDALIDGELSGDYPPSRLAHLLPALPADRQAPAIHSLVADLVDGAPAWFEALVASRVAPLMSRAWPERDRPPSWSALIDRLATVPLLDEPHADVLRAHPFAVELLSVTTHHEVTAHATDELMARWSAPLESAAPPPVAAPPSPPAAPPPPAPPAAPPLPDPSLGDVRDGSGPRALGPRPTRPRRTRARSASPPPTDDLVAEKPRRRVQAEVWAGSSQVERAFIAGAVHEVQVSIGHLATIGAPVAFPDVEFPPEVDRLPLLVRFAWCGDVQEAVIQLPRDEARESTVATFTLEPAAKDEAVVAVVAVYRQDHPAQVLQALVLRGPVVADLATERQASTSIDLAAEADLADLVTALPSTATVSVVAGCDQVLAADDAAAVSIDRSTLAAEVERLADAIRAKADLISIDESQLGTLLRDLALHGRAFHSRIATLLPDRLRDATHVQVVAADAQDVLPLEFVYDGPPPTKRSVLCATWTTAVRSGSCAGCEGGGPDGDVEDPRVCPNRFWALSKVIERHANLRSADGGFRVRSERVDGRARLGVLTGSVVGASELVTAKDVHSTVRTARAAFGTTSKAATWAKWRRSITKGPSVLVALPHHATDDDIDPPLSALELGGELLHSGAITAHHVRGGARAVGPLVMLVGCHTGADRSAFDSFAGDFRTGGASVVVSTVGVIRADQAPEAARLLIRALDREQDRGGTVGEALRSMRRELLADGKVLGLLMVAHGDADWTMGD
jgi:hypothetical protein